jgi:hypothetical protein
MLPEIPGDFSIRGTRLVNDMWRHWNWNYWSLRLWNSWAGWFHMQLGISCFFYHCRFVLELGLRLPIASFVLALNKYYSFSTWFEIYHTTSLLLINIVVQRAQNFIYRSNLFWNRMNSSEIWPSLSPWSDQTKALIETSRCPPAQASLTSICTGEPVGLTSCLLPSESPGFRKSLFKQVPSDFRDTQRGRSPKSWHLPVLQVKLLAIGQRSVYKGTYNASV